MIKEITLKTPKPDHRMNLTTIGFQLPSNLEHVSLKRPRKSLKTMTANIVKAGHGPIKGHL
jgi:hypothetical protein